MSVLVDVDDFRRWAGAAVASVPDELVQACLDEAEAALAAEVQTTIAAVAADPAAAAIGTGDVYRRAARLLARRNSPEGIAGTAEFQVTIPVRDPDSARAVAEIRNILAVPIVIA